MQKWVYKLECPNCGHIEMDEFPWEHCPVCHGSYKIITKYPGGE